MYWTIATKLLLIILCQMTEIIPDQKNNYRLSTMYCVCNTKYKTSYCLASNTWLLKFRSKRAIPQKDLNSHLAVQFFLSTYFCKHLILKHLLYLLEIHRTQVSSMFDSELGVSNSMFVVCLSWAMITYFLIKGDKIKWMTLAISLPYYSNILVLRFLIFSSRRNCIMLHIWMCIPHWE